VMTMTRIGWSVGIDTDGDHSEKKVGHGKRILAIKGQFGGWFEKLKFKIMVEVRTGAGIGKYRIRNHGMGACQRQTVKPLGS